MFLVVSLPFIKTRINFSNICLQQSKLLTFLDSIDIKQDLQNIQHYTLKKLSLVNRYKQAMRSLEKRQFVGFRIQFEFSDSDSIQTDSVESNEFFQFVDTMRLQNQIAFACIAKDMSMNFLTLKQAKGKKLALDAIDEQTYLGRKYLYVIFEKKEQKQLLGKRPFVDLRDLAP